MSGKDPPLYYTLITLFVTPDSQTQQKQNTMQYINKKVSIMYDNNNAIEPYNNIGAWGSKMVGLAGCPVGVFRKNFE